MKLSVQSSRPEAVRYCFILLVSYYQQSQSTPTAPRTQSPFYITFIRRCTNVENIWRQPSELRFLQGWGASTAGGDLQLARCESVHWAGQQWHHEGHLHSSLSSPIKRRHTHTHTLHILLYVSGFNSCLCTFGDLLNVTLFKAQSVNIAVKYMFLLTPHW